MARTARRMIREANAADAALAAQAAQDAADLARMENESAIMGSEDTLAGMAASEEEGAALAASEENESTEGAGEEGQQEAPTDTFAAQFNAHGGNLPRGICKALRAIAKDYQGARKDFIASATAMGLNPGNAAAEWQAGRKA